MNTIVAIIGDRTIELRKDVRKRFEPGYPILEGE